MRRTSRVSTASLLTPLILGSALAGCAFGGATPTAPPPSATGSTPTAEPDSAIGRKDLPRERTVLAFLNDLAADSPTALRRAQRITAPSSPASGYLAIRLGLASAQGRTEEVPHELVRLDNGHDLCVRTSGPPSCVRVADFTGTSRKIAGFTLEGAELGERMVLGDETAETGDEIPVEAELTGAFESVQAPYLLVVLTLKAPQTQPIRVRGGARYTTSDGRRLPPSKGFAGPRRLAAGQLGHYAFSVARAQLGGTLEVHVTGLDGRSQGSVLVRID